MAVVEVAFSALPAHVHTARLVASAVARRAGVADRVLDEVRVAVGEACSRAVDLHQRSVPGEAVKMTISDEHGRLVVSVIDAVPDVPTPAPERDAIGSGRFDPATIASPSARSAPESALDFLPEGFGLAVIRALVDDVEITPESDSAGTRVCMSWPLDGRP